jgi:hypothetical protein
LDFFQEYKVYIRIGTRISFFGVFSEGHYLPFHSFFSSLSLSSLSSLPLLPPSFLLFLPLVLPCSLSPPSFLLFLPLVLTSPSSFLLLLPLSLSSLSLLLSFLLFGFRVTYFIFPDVITKTEEDFRKLHGLVESRLRFMIKSLDNTEGIEYVHPKMGSVDYPHEVEGTRSTAFFIGLSFKPGVTAVCKRRGGKGGEGREGEGGMRGEGEGMERGWRGDGEGRGRERGGRGGRRYTTRRRKDNGGNHSQINISAARNEFRNKVTQQVPADADINITVITAYAPSPSSFPPSSFLLPPSSYLLPPSSFLHPPSSSLLPPSLF